MSGGIVGIIIQLIAGAAGGNVVAALAKQLDLGPLWNSVAGIIGGGIGGQIWAPCWAAEQRGQVVSISARLSDRSLPAVSVAAC